MSRRGLHLATKFEKKVLMPHIWPIFTRLMRCPLAFTAVLTYSYS